MWLLYSQIIQLWEGEPSFNRNDYREACFQALNCDPGSAEAHEALGYVLDVYFDDFERSKDAFNTAISLGAGLDSYLGLGRVLAEMGDGASAIEMLKQCPFSDDPSILKLISEIKNGIWK